MSPDIEILKPINLELRVTRNLAASWFTKIPGMQIQGVLKSMNVGVQRFLVLTIMRAVKNPQDRDIRVYVIMNPLAFLSDVSGPRGLWRADEDPSREHWRGATTRTTIRLL